MDIPADKIGTYKDILRKMEKCKTNKNINFEDLISLEIRTLYNYGIIVSREQLLHDLERINDKEEKTSQTDQLREIFKDLSSEPELNPRLERLKSQIEAMRKTNPSVYGKVKIKKKNN